MRRAEVLHGTILPAFPFPGRRYPSRLRSRRLSTARQVVDSAEPPKDDLSLNPLNLGGLWLKAVIIRAANRALCLHGEGNRGRWRRVGRQHDLKAVAGKHPS